MKTLLLLLAIGIMPFSFGQRIKSSCTAHDSIKAKYREDADRLALRRIYRDDLNYKNDPKIPKLLSDTLLKAILAVYNTVSLPSRDSVFLVHNIHTFPDPVMDNFFFGVDGSLAWAKLLNSKIVPCGHSAIDSIIKLYSLKFQKQTGGFIISLETDSNCNLIPLVNYIKTITGIKFAQLNNFIGDGDNITDSVFKDHVQINFSHGWGDCQAGCIHRRYWRFNVYYDCSVEFVKSYGSSIGGIHKRGQELISVSPNPFKESVFIKGISGEFSYSISNVLGKEYINGYSATGTISNLEKLNSGIYILSLQTENGKATFKVIKE